MAVGCVVLAGCRALPPVPVLPFHASTVAEPRGEVTVTLVVGLVMQGLGGGGVGSALRVEHQTTDRTALGGELAIGWLEADEDRFWLVAVRGYGRFMPPTHDWVAATYGVGASVLTSGMVSAQVHGGGAVAYPNDYVVPYLSLGAAVSVPLRDGEPFGHRRGRVAWRAHREDRLAGAVPWDFAPAVGTPRPPKPEIYVVGSVGAAVPLGDTGNALSLDLGAARTLLDDAVFLGLSLADTQR